MNQLRTVAAMIGLVALALSVSLHLNGGLLAEMAASIANSPALIILSGVLILVAGLAIVRGEGAFGPVKLVGWLFVLGGIGRIVFVRQVADLTTQLGQQPHAQMFAAVATAVIGIVFTYLGWFTKPRAEAPTSYES